MKDTGATLNAYKQRIHYTSPCLRTRQASVHLALPNESNLEALHHLDMFYLIRVAKNSSQILNNIEWSGMFFRPESSNQLRTSFELGSFVGQYLTNYLTENTIPSQETL